MNAIEIRSFRYVILFEMQRFNMGTMTFSEAWKACERANDLLPTPTNTSDRKLFAWRLHEALKVLQEEGWIHLRYTSPEQDKKVKGFTLTDYGAQTLRTVVFTHQDRMGDRP